jgi:hypothetical protein
MFPNSDAAALAQAALGLLADPARRDALRDEATRCVRKYDWSVVAADILSVYEMVTESTAQVSTRASQTRTGAARSGTARFSALGNFGSLGGFGLGGSGSGSNSGSGSGGGSGSSGDGDRASGGRRDEPQPDSDRSQR